MLRILSSVALNTVLAGGLTCQTGEIRFYEFQKQRTEKADYCFNQDHTELRSKNCQSGTCAALTAKILPEVKLEGASVGNPSFVLCRKLGGDPKIIEFQTQGTWHQLDRCYFEKDKSFVDGGSLLSIWIQDNRM